MIKIEITSNNIKEYRKTSWYKIGVHIESLNNSNSNSNVSTRLNIEIFDDIRNFVHDQLIEIKWKVIDVIMPESFKKQVEDYYSELDD